MAILAIIVICCIVCGFLIGPLMVFMWMDADSPIPYLGMLLTWLSGIVGVSSLVLLLLGAIGLRLVIH